MSLHAVGDELLLFWCEPCGHAHPFRIKPDDRNPPGPVWTWNGDMKRPTFSPSLLVHPHWTFKKGTTREQIEEAMKITPTGQVLVGITEMTPRCHLFLRDGMIEYCADSEHALAGKTVPLGPFPWEK